jgi:lipopolysaccharide transport system permease protein
VAVARNLWSHRELIVQFAKRDTLGRYRGSYLGVGWSFLIPLFMLGVFTLVFGVIFQGRWGLTGSSKLEFALILFCGLIVFNVFADCVTRAPELIRSHTNLVKKVVFPLEILPVMVMATATLHAGVSLVILLLGLWLGAGIFHWTVVFVPLLYVPLGLLCLGLVWFLAAVGAFVRDIGQVMSVLTTSVLFLSPIFYPVSSIPEWLRPLYQLNPLTFLIEQMRAVIIWGEVPNGWHLFIVALAALFAALAGHAWFQRWRGEFADVL